MRAVVYSLFLLACTSPSGPVGFDSDEVEDTDDKSDGIRVPDVRCAADPETGPAGEFRHLAGSVIALLGDPRHRGIDLVATAADEVQTLAGAVSYTVADKALEDEDVELFACRAARWERLGRVRTDHDGRFELALSGAARLPIGLRDLVVSVVGDRTSARFLAYVARGDARLLVSDIDGTLTSSENAFLATIVRNIEPDAQPGSAEAFHRATDRGYQVAYLSARGRQYTAETRAWLEHLGFPRGPLRLSPSFIVFPGADTVEFKTTALQALAVTVAMGIGNRESDITAYTRAGLDPSDILVKLPEFADEVRAPLDRGAATALATYADLDVLAP